jgi:hypothetical protein
MKLGNFGKFEKGVVYAVKELQPTALKTIGDIETALRLENCIWYNSAETFACNAASQITTHTRDTDASIYTGYYAVNLHGQWSKPVYGGRRR